MDSASPENASGECARHNSTSRDGFPLKVIWRWISHTVHTCIHTRIHENHCFSANFDLWCCPAGVWWVCVFILLHFPPPASKLVRWDDWDPWSDEHPDSADFGSWTERSVMSRTLTSGVFRTCMTHIIFKTPLENNYTTPRLFLVRTDGEWVKIETNIHLTYPNFNTFFQN